MHENWWRTLLQSVPVTQVTSRNTRAELATRSEGCTCYRIEEIRWPWEWSSSAQGDLWQWPLCWFSNPWHSTFRFWTSWKNRKEKDRRLIEHFESHPNRNVLLKYFEKSEEINHFSQETKDLITEMGNNDILEFYETFFEKTMSRLRLILGNGYRILHMRKMHAAYSNESTMQQTHIWLIVDSWKRNKEEPIPRSQVWSINASNNVSQSTWCVEKSQTSKEWFVRDYSGKMVHRCRLSKVVLWWRLDRRENQTIRRTCPGRPFLWSYTWRKETMAKELVCCLSKGGVQGPIRQRPDFRKAKHAYRRLYKEHVESTGQGNKSIHSAQQRRQHSQHNLMNTRSTPFRFTLELDGDIILQQVRLHPRSGSRTMNGSGHKVGIVGDLQPGLNSKFLRSKSSALGNLWLHNKKWFRQILFILIR